MWCTHMSTKPVELAHIIRLNEPDTCKNYDLLQQHKSTKIRHSPVNSPKKRLQTRRSRGLMLSFNSSLVRWMPSSSNTRGRDVSTSPTTYRHTTVIQPACLTAYVCRVFLTCERILYSGSSTNSTKLRWELLLGAFFVNFLLTSIKHELQSRSKETRCHAANCLWNKISLRFSRFRVEVNVSPQSFSKLHVVDVTWKTVESN